MPGAYSYEYMDEKTSHLNHWDINNLYGWAMLQKLYMGSFKWADKTCQISKDFIKSSNGHSDEQYFPEVDVQYPEILHDIHNTLPF